MIAYILLALAVGLVQARPQTFSETIECPASGHHLLAHEYDCTKFYSCDGGVKAEVASDCGPNTEFSYDLQVCIHPMIANCNLSGVPPPEPDSVELLPNGCPANFSVHHLLPHETECSQFYYCNFGEKLLRDCAPGTHFNPSLQVCDWPANAGCANSGNGGNGEAATTTTQAPITPEASPTTTEASTTTEAATTTTEAAAETDGTTTSAPVDGLLPNGCPVDFSIHHLLPHETECSQFYQCNFGEKVLRDCAPGTHFNPSLQVCDWPANAGCANSGNGGNGEAATTTTQAPITPEASPTTTEASTTTEAATTTTEAAAVTTEAATTTTEAAAVTTEADPTTTEASPTTTEASTTTEAATTTTEAAAVTTEADPTTTEAAAVTTTEAAPTTTEAATTTTEAAATTTEAAPETNGTTTSAPVDGLLPNGCPVDFSVHHLLPHETECSQFYYCNFGEKVLRDCAPGTHFNPSLQICDWPANAGCANSGNVTTEASPETTEATSATTEASPETTEATSATTEASPETTEATSATTEASPETTEASSPTTEASPETTEATSATTEASPETTEATSATTESSPETTETSSPTTEASPETTEATSATTEASPETTEASSPTTEAATETTESVNSTTTSAPETTESVNSTTTSAPETTESVNSTTTSAPETTESVNSTTTFAPENTTTSAPETTEAVNTTTTSAPPTTDKEEEITDECAELCNVLPWAHDTDCDKFWMCAGGKRELVVCSEGLHFNAKTLTCDFICNANCVRDNAQATIQNDGVRIFMPWDRIDDDMVQNFIKASAYVHH